MPGGERRTERRMHPGAPLVARSLQPGTGNTRTGALEQVSPARQGVRHEGRVEAPAPSPVWDTMPVYEDDDLLAVDVTRRSGPVRKIQKARPQRGPKVWHLWLVLVLFGCVPWWVGCVEIASWILE